MPPQYRKIGRGTWTDEKFAALSPIPPCGAGLWLFLLTGPFTTAIPGLYVAGKAAMAEALNWEQSDFDKAFDEILSSGMARYDAKTKLVWLPNALKYNFPDSPNVVISWAPQVEMLPSSKLAIEAVKCFGASICTTDTYRKAYDKVFRRFLGNPPRIPPGIPPGTPPGIPTPIQEQEQEQEAGEENSAADRGTRSWGKLGDNGENFSTGEDDLFGQLPPGLNLDEDPETFEPPVGTNLTEKQFAELVHEAGGEANAIEVARLYADVIKPGYGLRFDSDFAGIRKFALEIYRRQRGLNSDQKVRASKTAKGATPFDLSAEDQALVEKMLTEIKTWPTLRNGNGARTNGAKPSSAATGGRA